MKIIAATCLLTACAVYGGSPVRYQHDDAVLEGYLSTPDTSSLTGSIPGVLICHAWRGIQDHERAVADSLAREGVAAFVLDIYGKGVRPDSPAEAGKLSGSFKNNRSLLRSRANAGLDYLRGIKIVNNRQIVAIGFCFGGTTAIELARSGADISGVASFHGGLDSPDPEAGAAIQTPILILHGADDPHVKEKDIAAMLSEFDKADVRWTMVSFSNAVHAFTDPAAGNDPSTGAAFQRRAAQDSWRIFGTYFEKWTGASIKGGVTDH